MKVLRAWTPNIDSVPPAHARTSTEPPWYDGAAAGPAAHPVVERRVSTPSPAARERARRRRHVEQLRRDLLVDAGVAFITLLILITVTAGLAVLGLLAAPATVLLIVSYVRDRRARRARRPPPQPTPPARAHRPARSHPPAASSPRARTTPPAGARPARSARESR